ncbi:LacI family DNA-binding transcriptional regulator [Collinsella tanakaei]|uniref:LacI family DNA-binding transcriptional regulator n=1 Tax=Collinsella tanakaei TaxID=626935 RepID=UPI00195D470B|nr:LacI family DNA-binding transcriptional regulator [Collinsella tanakaei]MBM6756842.1 LacI family DNA-binding transcriptional regulator [Collinsella tanakaei]
MSDRRATISDVAMAAGVSKTTVSRFINGQADRISPATRRRIERAIKSTHFHPSSAARSLKARGNDIICLIVPTFEAPSVGAFLQHASHALINAGHTAVILGPCDTPEALGKQHAVLAGMNPAGILIAGNLSQDDLKTLMSGVLAPILPYANDTGEKAASTLLSMMAEAE